MASVHTDLNYYTWKVSDKTYSSPDPMPRFVRRCRGDCRGDLLGDLSAKEWQHQLVIFYFFYTFVKCARHQQQSYQPLFCCCVWIKHDNKLQKHVANVFQYTN